MTTHPLSDEGGSPVYVFCYRLCGTPAVEQLPELGPPDGWRYAENEGWYCPDCARAWLVYDCCGIRGGCGGPCAAFPCWELTT